MLLAEFGDDELSSHVMMIRMTMKSDDFQPAELPRGSPEHLDINLNFVVELRCIAVF
jgi:hypothetical protein